MRTIPEVLLLSLFGAFGVTSASADPIQMTLRSRVPSADASIDVESEKIEEWDPSKTAIVICDMWDKHWCPTATARVGEMAPVMNRVVQAARAKGVLIVHSPSDTLGFYEGAPQRKLAQNAPKAANLPKDITNWCSLQKKEGDLPIDDSDGGCDCGKPTKSYKAWSRQIEAIEIAPEDAISDKGDEVWNLFEARGIDNVIVMGVHTNMCVLGRPFGIRNLVKNGKNVVLMRDMTDTMYNPKMEPKVSHFRGTELVIEHIEKHWCPTTTSTVFTGEPAFRFQGDEE